MSLYSCCSGVCFVVAGSSKNLASFHGAVFVCGCVSLPRAFSSVSSGGIVAEKSKRVLLTVVKVVKFEGGNIAISMLPGPCIIYRLFRSVKRVVKVSH